MKIFLVGDNAPQPNWGRGASIALSQLFTILFDVSGRITGDQFLLKTANFGYVDTLTPARFYRFFKRALLSRNKSKLASWYVKCEEKCGARDFISQDPLESVDNLLKGRVRYSELGKIYDQARRADLILVDGDGDIVFSTPPRRQTLFLLAMIALGIRLQKRVAVVNTMLSDCPVTGQNRETLASARALFAQCRTITVRDPESLEYAQEEMPEVRVSCIPDSLFSWFPLYQDTAQILPDNGDFMIPFPEQAELLGKLDFSVPYICLGGGALAASQSDRALFHYNRLVDALKELGYPIYLTESDQPDSFLRQVAEAKGIGLVPFNAPILMCGAVLASARLFISGRYHPSIFASLGGTPCVFLASHAHKMGSLARVLEYDDCRQFDAFPNESEVVKIIATSKDYLAQGESLRARIRSAAKRRCDEVRQLPDYVLHQANG